MATIVQLKDLLTLELGRGPFISIFTPFSALHRLPDQIHTAKNHFIHRYSADRWIPYQKKIQHVQLPHLKRGSVAIYIGPTIVRIFKLNYSIHSRNFISGVMKIIPLILDIQHRYHSIPSTKQKISHDLRHIISVAPAGLINTLFLNASKADLFDPTLNDLAITTLGFNGHVIVLSDRDMPNHEKVAMISRTPSL